MFGDWERCGLFFAARAATKTSLAVVDLVALDLSIIDEIKNSKSGDLRREDWDNAELNQNIIDSRVWAQILAQMIRRSYELQKL